MKRPSRPRKIRITYLIAGVVLLWILTGCSQSRPATYSGYGDYLQQHQTLVCREMPYYCNPPRPTAEVYRETMALKNSANQKAVQDNAIMSKLRCYKDYYRALINHNRLNRKYKAYSPINYYLRSACPEDARKGEWRIPEVE